MYNVYAISYEGVKQKNLIKALLKIVRAGKPDSGMGDFKLTSSYSQSIFHQALASA